MLVMTWMGALMIFLHFFFSIVYNWQCVWLWNVGFSRQKIRTESQLSSLSIWRKYSMLPFTLIGIPRINIFTYLFQLNFFHIYINIYIYIHYIYVSVIHVFVCAIWMCVYVCYIYIYIYIKCIHTYTYICV